MDHGSGLPGRWRGLSLQTHKHWGQVGKHPWGEGMCWGRIASSPCPCGAINIMFGPPRVSKTRWFCRNHYSWPDEAQTLWLVRISVIEKFYFVLDWGHKSAFWIIFLAVKEYFKMYFSPPSLSATLLQHKVEHPSHTAWTS